jgi:hypothetical protein
VSFALLLVHQQDRIIAVLVGRPACNLTWQAACNKVADAILERLLCIRGPTDHCQGKFVYLSTGLTMGPGSLVLTSPVNALALRVDRPLQHLSKSIPCTADQRTVLNELLAMPGLQQMLEFSSSACREELPLFAFAHASIRRVGHLVAKGVLPRPQRLAHPQGQVPVAYAADLRQHMDLAHYQLRAALRVARPSEPPEHHQHTLLGHFDDTKGGHPVLLDFRVLVQFPAGSVVHILSSPMRHANTPVAEGKFRISVIQYMSDSLSRFMDAGYKCVKNLPKHVAAALQALAPA